MCISACIVSGWVCVCVCVSVCGLHSRGHSCTPPPTCPTAEFRASNWSVRCFWASANIVGWFGGGDDATASAIYGSLPINERRYSVHLLVRGCETALCGVIAWGVADANKYNNPPPPHPQSARRINFYMLCFLFFFSSALHSMM